MATPAPSVVAAPGTPTTPAAPVAAPATASRTIQLNVTDPDIIAEIDSWADGQAYTFDVTQTTANTFEIVDAYGEEAAEEEAPAAPAGNGGNPAISKLLNSR